MLRVGIHDNVVVSKVVINEHGTLEIEFTQPIGDALGALEGNAEMQPEQNVNIRVYKQEVEYFGEKRTGTKMLTLITGFKAVLTELLNVYIDNPTIDATKGIKVTKDTVNDIFTDQDNVDKAYKIITTQFIKLITPHLNSDTGFRVKLPRRSAKYAFASLPTFCPWVESMDIPKEASKLRWSKWEIDNGKNDPNPPVDQPTDADVKEQVSDLENVFGKKEDVKS